MIKITDDGLVSIVGNAEDVLAQLSTIIYALSKQSKVPESAILAAVARALVFAEEDKGDSKEKHYAEISPEDMAKKKTMDKTTTIDTSDDIQQFKKMFKDLF